MSDKALEGKVQDTLIAKVLAHQVLDKLIEILYASHCDQLNQ